MTENFQVLQKGVRFECQGSGKCCLSRGQYGYVYLTKKDRKRLADHFDLNPSAFTRKYCDKTAGHYHLKTKSEMTECEFLKENKCSVYEARPVQCRTWPFWPEVMNAKSWKKEVADFCPGVGKGKFYRPEEVREILEWQKRSELD